MLRSTLGQLSCTAELQASSSHVAYEVDSEPGFVSSVPGVQTNAFAVSSIHVATSNPGSGLLAVCSLDS